MLNPYFKDRLKGVTYKKGEIHNHMTRDIMGVSNKKTEGENKKLGWVNFCKKSKFSTSFRHTSSGRPFKIIGASYAKLRTKC